MADAYYNENDPAAAAWLRELIRAGQIAPGDVDERSIEDVVPQELRGYRQCHFFAGIGVWSYALRCAGVADSARVWTGSCPCQPFSSAGKGAGFADERHLWPAWHWLIEQCRPELVLGEQVANRAGLGWLRLVQTDLEAAGYRCGAVDLCAAGVGAPQIRQRLFFVACASGQRLDGIGLRLQPGESRQADVETSGRGQVSLLAGTTDRRPETGSGDGGRQSAPRGRGADVIGCGGVGGLASSDRTERGRRAAGAQEYAPEGQDNTPGSSKVEQLGGADEPGLAQRPLETDQPPTLRIEGATFGAAEPLRGFWSGADWLYCRDGKYRPVEPGTFPLASRAPGRVGRLRGYGNALCAPAAQAFIEAARGICGAVEDLFEGKGLSRG